MLIKLINTTVTYIQDLPKNIVKDHIFYFIIIIIIVIIFIRICEVFGEVIFRIS